MLAAARRRVARLPATRRARCLLCERDLRAFALQPRFTLAVAAFHSVQHLYAEADLLRFLRATRACLVPEAGWRSTCCRRIQRGSSAILFVAGAAPCSATRYRGSGWSTPTTTASTHVGAFFTCASTISLSTSRTALGPERVVRLCHRQLEPSLVKSLLVKQASACWLVSAALTAGFSTEIRASQTSMSTWPQRASLRHTAAPPSIVALLARRARPSSSTENS